MKKTFQAMAWSLAALLVPGLALSLAQPPAAPAQPKQPAVQPPAKLTPPPATPGAPPAAAPQPAPATIVVVVPASATIVIGDQKMTSTGPRRSFQSPALEPGKAYYYTLKVSWPTQPGQPEHTTQHEVTVRAGQTTEIDFTPLAGGAGVVQPAPGTILSPSRPSIFRRPEGSGYR